MNIRNKYGTIKQLTRKTNGCKALVDRVLCGDIMWLVTEALVPAADSAMAVLPEDFCEFCVCDNEEEEVHGGFVIVLSRVIIQAI